MRIHRVFFKAGFGEQARFWQYLWVVERAVVALDPRTPYRVAVDIIASYVAQQFDDMVGVVVALHALAAQLVKDRDRALLLFGGRYTYELIDRETEQL